MSGSEHLRTSENDYDWLGSGIYFWENSAARALEWAHAASKNSRISKARIREPFVVGAIIDLGNCLDLLESESIRIVESAHDRLVEACANAGVSCPQNHEVNGELMVRQLDCAVINTHVIRQDARQPAFDSVRSAFFEGARLYPNAGFQRQTHTQICLRRHQSIRGYFRPIDLA